MAINKDQVDTQVNAASMPTEIINPITDAELQSLLKDANLAAESFANTDFRLRLNAQQIFQLANKHNSICDKLLEYQDAWTKLTKQELLELAYINHLITSKLIIDATLSDGKQYGISVFDFRAIVLNDLYCGQNSTYSAISHSGSEPKLISLNTLDIAKHLLPYANKLTHRELRKLLFHPRVTNVAAYWLTNINPKELLALGTTSDGQDLIDLIDHSLRGVTMASKLDDTKIIDLISEPRIRDTLSSECIVTLLNNYPTIASNILTLCMQQISPLERARLLKDDNYKSLVPSFTLDELSQLDHYTLRSIIVHLPPAEQTNIVTLPSFTQKFTFTKLLQLCLDIDNKQYFTDLYNNGLQNLTPQQTNSFIDFLHVNVSKLAFLSDAQIETTLKVLVNLCNTQKDSSINLSQFFIMSNHKDTTAQRFTKIFLDHPEWHNIDDGLVRLAINRDINPVTDAELQTLLKDAKLAAESFDNTDFRLRLNAQQIFQLADQHKSICENLLEYQDTWTKLTKQELLKLAYKNYLITIKLIGDATLSNGTQYGISLFDLRTIFLSDFRCNRECEYPTISRSGSAPKMIFLKSLDVAKHLLQYANQLTQSELETLFLSPSVAAYWLTNINPKELLALGTTSDGKSLIDLINLALPRMTKASKLDDVTVINLISEPRIREKLSSACIMTLLNNYPNIAGDILTLCMQQISPLDRAQLLKDNNYKSPVPSFTLDELSQLDYQTLRSIFVHLPPVEQTNIVTLPLFTQKFTFIQLLQLCLNIDDKQFFANCYNEGLQNIKPKETESLINFLFVNISELSFLSDTQIETTLKVLVNLCSMLKNDSLLYRFFVMSNHKDTTSQRFTKIFLNHPEWHNLNDELARLIPLMRDTLSNATAAAAPASKSTQRNARSTVMFKDADADTEKTCDFYDSLATVQTLLEYRINKITNNDFETRSPAILSDGEHKKLVLQKLLRIVKNIRNAKQEHDVDSLSHLARKFAAVERAERDSSNECLCKHRNWGGWLANSLLQPLKTALPGFTETFTIDPGAMKDFLECKRIVDALLLAAQDQAKQAPASQIRQPQPQRHAGNNH